MSLYCLSSYPLYPLGNKDVVEKMRIKIILLIILIIGGCFIVVNIWREREKNERINPAIFPVFRTIELEAMKYCDQQVVDKDKYAMYKKVLKLYETSMPADEYYLVLQRLGFDLPSLYLDRKPTTEEIEKANKEQKIIKEMQTEYLKKYLEKISGELKGKYE
jgi:hypothetical protein